MERLKSHRDFVSVLKVRKRVVSQDVVIQYAPTIRVFIKEKRSSLSDMCVTDMSIKRRYLGLAVSVAVGNAVVRNHVKRQLRVLARKYENILPLGVAIVIRPKPSIATVSFETIDQQIHYLFKKINWRESHPQSNTQRKSHNYYSNSDRSNTFNSANMYSDFPTDR